MDYHSEIAQDVDDAKERWEKSKDVDPFPKIGSALLNSADICSYAKQVGLVYPFRSDNKSLKTASVAARVGECIYAWNPERDKDNHKYQLETDQEFKLRPFSLAFIETEETFFLPNYIAARFNLRIELIHKGLLLGTGPLIDPGFKGKILVPIHNLTKNHYVIRRGENLIWVEFSKTSWHTDWGCEIANEEGAKHQTKELMKFDIEKVDLSPDQYLARAMRIKTWYPHKAHKSIVSAIPSQISEVRRLSQQALGHAKNTRRLLFGLGFLSASGVAAAFFVLFLEIYGIVGRIDDQLYELRMHVNELESMRAEPAVLAPMDHPLPSPLEHNDAGLEMENPDSPGVQENGHAVDDADGNSDDGP